MGFEETEKNDKLLTLRNEIDALDDEIASLLARRGKIVDEIGEYKKENRLHISDDTRERAIIARLTAGKSREDVEYITAVFGELFRAGRARQLPQTEYALVGRNLIHSYSQPIHRCLGNNNYQLKNLSKSGFVKFISDRKFKGVNITIPYKSDAAVLCDTLSPVAAQTGAVNTIVCKNGNLLGYNTDYFGFMYMLRRAGISLEGKRVLILGSGGASKTAQYAAKTCGAEEITVVSRTGSVNYDNIQLYNNAEILINTTPVGTFPESAALPMSLEGFERLEAVMDVIYNPARTRLLLSAAEKGIKTCGGIAMLAAQAYKSNELFFGKTDSDTALCESEYENFSVEAIINRIRMKMGNIVLIGMPGCGKTRIGTIVAQRLHKQFVDTDALSLEECGMPIPDFMNIYGEEAFRKIESEAVRKASLLRGAVISTGGGSVLKEENTRELRENGCLIYIVRDSSKLAVRGRPISESSNLEALFREREHIYLSVADTQIDNNRGTLEAAVSKVISAFEKLKI